MLKHNLRLLFGWIAIVLLAPTAIYGQGKLLGVGLGSSGFGSSWLNPGGEGEEKVVAVRAQFTAPRDNQPARLFITATIKAGWHIYSITQKKGGPLPTEILLDRSPSFSLTGGFLAFNAPKKKQESGFSVVSEMHEGRVTWYAPLQLAADADPASVKIIGAIKVQACDPNNCNFEDLPFTAMLGEGMDVTSMPGGEGLDFQIVTYQVDEKIDLATLAVQLGLAFLGGLILNLMPCVLPVISLKILSFLGQAGESRSRIFTLNLWYSLGLLAVFLVLAVLAATAGLAWGEQFTLPWFKVAMCGLVFVMALSFLGVWDIPIPGFVGRGRAVELQTQEGPQGAFFKGVFTTILATPCSGPFLGPVFGYLLTQPPLVTYLIFSAVGLGMASPYLLIGAFPKLIRYLPKPGAWMQTLEQLMAFLLLGTVVYLFTTLSPNYFIPTLTLLVGLWFGCWWIGRTPLTAGPKARRLAWTGGILSAMAVGVLAFTLLLQQSNIPWQPFTPEALAQARAQGKTVLVDFSANWCLTCKANLKFAIDTKKVAQLVEANQVVPLLADWTDRSPVIKTAINELGKNSIPLLVIWPAGAANTDPIVLTDLLQESQVLEALKQAGPSRP
jgi:cytochrome c biogenesis protein CcdA